MAGLGKGFLQEKQGVQVKKINRAQRETKAASEKRNGELQLLEGRCGQPAE